MKNLFFLLLILPLTSCSGQELGWFILSPNNVEGLTNLKFLLSGLTTTIYISVVSIIISAILGFIVAIPSLAKNKFLTYKYWICGNCKSNTTTCSDFMDLLRLTNNDRNKFQSFCVGNNCTCNK